MIVDCVRCRCIVSRVVQNYFGCRCIVSRVVQNCFGCRCIVSRVVHHPSVTLATLAYHCCTIAWSVLTCISLLHHCTEGVALHIFVALLHGVPALHITVALLHGGRCTAYHCCIIAWNALHCISLLHYCMECVALHITVAQLHGVRCMLL